MSVSANIERVQSIYAAFGRGDIPAILESLHPDVEWEFGAQHTAIPWLVPRRGREGAAAMFESLKPLRFEVFEVLSVMGAGDWVVGLLRIEAVHTVTGRRLVEVCEPHVWRFDGNGSVVAMRHGADTLHHATVLGLAGTA